MTASCSTFHFGLQPLPDSVKPDCHVVLLQLEQPGQLFNRQTFDVAEQEQTGIFTVQGRDRPPELLFQQHRGLHRVQRSIVGRRLRAKLAAAQHIYGGVNRGAAKIRGRQRHVLNLCTACEYTHEYRLQDVLRVGRITGNPQGRAEHRLVVALVQPGNPGERGRGSHQNGQLVNVCAGCGHLSALPSHDAQGGRILHARRNNVGMTSGRLTYRPVAMATVGDFHALMQDEHVRRYLMDGQVSPISANEERVRDSIDLFNRRGVGLWLAYETRSGELAGFCGFLDIPSMHPEPQLVYALLERFCGIGYTTEMAAASIAEARRHAGFDTIAAGVDEVNIASVHVLEKLGFRRAATYPGSFGTALLFLLEGDR